MGKLLSINKKGSLTSRDMVILSELKSEHLETVRGATNDPLTKLLLDEVLKLRSYLKEVYGDEVSCALAAKVPQACA